MLRLRTKLARKEEVKLIGLEWVTILEEYERVELELRMLKKSKFAFCAVLETNTPIQDIFADLEDVFYATTFVSHIGIGFFILYPARQTLMNFT